MIKLVLNGSQQNGGEQELIRPIIERLYAILKEDNKLSVVLLPLYDGNDSQALSKAISASNAINPDYHLAIHADAGYEAIGASGLYYSEKGKSFISPILKEIMDVTPWADVGLRKRDNLGELKRTTAIAGLIELSFYDNPNELEWMKNNTELIAQTLRTGLYKSLDIKIDNKYEIAIGQIKKILEVL